jgi:hypothetical protein
MHRQDRPADRSSASRPYHRDHSPEEKPLPPNGSKTVSVMFRFAALILALSSAAVMGGPSECPLSSGVIVTYTYFRFGVLVGCNITATVLEVAAIYLQFKLYHAAAPVSDIESVATDIEQEEEGIRAAKFFLMVMDLTVMALIISAMVVTCTAAAIYGDQVGRCSQFAKQVVRARALSIAAFVAVAIVPIATAVPLPFNMPPALALK